MAKRWKMIRRHLRRESKVKGTIPIDRNNSNRRESSVISLSPINNDRRRRLGVNSVNDKIRKRSNIHNIHNIETNSNNKTSINNFNHLGGS